jgi:hypothetical protein
VFVLFFEISMKMLKTILAKVKHTSRFIVYAKAVDSTIHSKLRKIHENGVT